MFPELKERAFLLARLIHCQRSEGDRPVHNCMMEETILFFLFSLFYSILSFFSFLLILTAEKIRRSCNGTSKSEQRKCSACKYLNCTIHLFFFFPVLLFVSILKIHFLFTLQIKELESASMLNTQMRTEISNATNTNERVSDDLTHLVKKE